MDQIARLEKEKEELHQALIVNQERFDKREISEGTYFHVKLNNLIALDECQIEIDTLKKC